MTFQITTAAPTVEVGLSSSDTPFTDPASVTWTDLSDRVISCETQSDSRDDRTAEFSAGSATIVLDNWDRLLDPTFSGSLVYQTGSEGLPGSPVRVTCNGEDVWYGVLAVSGECWQVSRTRGKHATTTLQAVTLTSFLASVAMPSSPWACGITSMSPDYWIRGNAASTALTNGDDLPDTITAGVNAVVAGSGSLTQATSLVPDDQNPSMAPGSGTYVRCYAADLSTTWLSGGTKTQLAASTIWQSSEISSGTDNVLSLVHNGTGHQRFTVTADSVGQLILTMYDTTGGAVTYDVAPDNPNSGGRWDDGSPHAVTVRWVGGSKLSIWVDGNVTHITTSVTATWGEADLRVGTSSGLSKVDEILFWRVPPTEADILIMHSWFLGTGAPLARETFSERVDSLCSLANWTGTITKHQGASDPELWGLGSVYSHPQTLAEALTQTADSYGGALWSTRSGTVRIRTASALASGSYTGQYVTPRGNLTNETSPSGSPTPIRRGVLQRTGARSDRLITAAAVTFGADAGVGVPSEDLVTTSAQAAASYLDRYGVKPAEIQTQAIVTGTFAADLAASMLLTTPPVEVQPVTIDVLNQDTLDWVTNVGSTGLGLEKMVTVSDTDAVWTMVTWTADLNVQGETFTWSEDGSLVVTVQLAASRVKTGKAKTATQSASRGIVVNGLGIAPGSITAKSLSPGLKSSLGLGTTGGTGTPAAGSITYPMLATSALPCIVSATMPTTTSDGQLWLNSSTWVLYIWNDSDGVYFEVQ